MKSTVGREVGRGGAGGGHLVAVPVGFEPVAEPLGGGPGHLDARPTGVVRGGARAGAQRAVLTQMTGQPDERPLEIHHGPRLVGGRQEGLQAADEQSAARLGDAVVALDHREELLGAREASRCILHLRAQLCHVGVAGGGHLFLLGLGQRLHAGGDGGVCGLGSRGPWWGRGRVRVRGTRWRLGGGGTGAGIGRVVVGVGLRGIAGEGDRCTRSTPPSPPPACAMPCGTITRTHRGSDGPRRASCTVCAWHTRGWWRRATAATLLVSSVAHAHDGLHHDMPHRITAGLIPLYVTRYHGAHAGLTAPIDELGVGAIGATISYGYGLTRHVAAARCKRSLMASPSPVFGIGATAIVDTLSSCLRKA